MTRLVDANADPWLFGVLAVSIIRKARRSISWLKAQGNSGDQSPGLKLKYPKGYYPNMLNATENLWKVFAEKGILTLKRAGLASPTQDVFSLQKRYSASAEM